MTTNTKQLEKASNPETEPRHRRPAKQQPEYIPSGLSDPRQAAGNLAVQRMLRGRVLQAKLMVGSLHDSLEDEADQVAEKVVHSSVFSVSKETRVPTTPGTNGSENALLRQKEASATSEQEIQVVPPVIKEVLSGDDGQALDGSTRSFMETRFGHDFSQVRVHTGKRAAESAQSVHALAYAVGRDIVFGEGQYAPQTSEGKRLLAHELTHVVQEQFHDTTLSQDKSILRRQPAPNNQAAQAPQGDQAAQALIDEYTNWWGLNLQEEKLAQRLVSIAREGHYAFVTQVINKLASSDRDDVAQDMMESFAIKELIQIARNPEGAAMLKLMADELGTGWTTSDEENKAQLLRAVLNDTEARLSWNRERIEVLKGQAKSDLEALALLFDDDEIVDDGTVSSRLQSILGATEHLIIPGLQTGINFGDTGFAGDQQPGGTGFRDPHPSSRNQVGHFLTAVGLQFSPQVVSRSIPIFGSIRAMVNAPTSMSDAEVALRLTIGHEKRPDPNGAVEAFANIVFAGGIERFLVPGPEGETDEERERRVDKAIEDEIGHQVRSIIAAFQAQFQATTDADIDAWNEALTKLGTDETLNKSALECKDSPLNRISINPAGKGNSIQDLRLSLVGWRLGQLIANGAFQDRASIARWIRINLGPSS